MLVLALQMPLLPTRWLTWKHEPISSLRNTSSEQTKDERPLSQYLVCRHRAEARSEEAAAALVGSYQETEAEDAAAALVGEGAAAGRVVAARIVATVGEEAEVGGGAIDLMTEYCAILSKL